MKLPEDILFQSEAVQIKARLKWFNPTKGFGFVIPEDNAVDAFFHVTQLQKHGVYALGQGAELLCNIEYGEKGASVVEIVEILSLGDCSELPVTCDSDLNGVFSTCGIVKLYYQDKGYGFILPDDGMKDIFIHKSCLDRSKVNMLEAGLRVRVTYKIAEKGREATEIAIEGPL